MKKIAALASLLLFCLAIWAQVPPKNNEYHIETQFLDLQEDEYGISHLRWQQVHLEYEIEGAITIDHNHAHRSIKQSGKLVMINQPLPGSIIPFEQALEAAKKEIETDFFYWEKPAYEKLIKELTGHERATFYPTQKLVWLDPEFSTNGANYRLAYKLDLFFNAPSDHKIIYIDAETGAKLFELDQCHEISKEGTAETRYHGTHSIIADSVAENQFILLDETRGGGIATRNMRTYTNVDSAVDFQDDDNYWDHHNTAMDDAAGDVHWGSEMTYDYYLEKHKRNSYDGKGSRILSYVHHNRNWRNASWNGRYARYGDGNSNPLTSIDVVAHELTHGVTGTSAGLIYRNESGALNESFSDIFGAAVEFYALGDEADWRIGRANFQLRDMSNTKGFSHPNTYGGVFWYTGTGDNGGVHINSGVQNYWFYLLSHGGEGSNDLGNSYKVDSIGIEKAAQIAYRNLVYYLTPSSTYADARAGSIEAAKDIFGPCSFEAEQVVKAWHAVGIGSEEHTNDLHVQGIQPYFGRCELAKEYVTIQISYAESSCDSVLRAGTNLDVYYQIEGNEAVHEVFTLAKDLKIFETRSYTFQTKADFSAKGRYQIQAWIQYSKDKIANNDSSEVLIVTNRNSPDKLDVIGFEPVAFEKESQLFTIEERSNSRVEIVARARKDGIRGLVFTGEPSGRIRDFSGPKTEAEIFTTQTHHIGKMCMCIDARTWADVKLSFDLRQTRSEIYYDHPGDFNPRTMTSLRITADGQQIDTIMHPDTTYNNLWQNHIVNLDAYAGRYFELCFEGKHFISNTSFSSENIGDNSFVDNINLFYDQLISDPPKFNIKWYPNPTDNQIKIETYQNADRTLMLRFTDATGRLVLEKEVNLLFGVNDLEVDLNDLSNGMYFMEMELEGESKLERLMIY